MAGRHLIAGPRGRLDVEVTGPDDGATLVFHMGTPSAGSMYGPLVELGAQRGLRHVVYMRPGYGDSERCPGRVVADCAADAAAVADWLGVKRFYTAGRSGGGPHALACAALLPDRVLATATIAGVAPWPAEGLDWLAGVGPENVTEFEAAMEGVDALTRFLEADAAQLRVVQATDVAGALGGLVGDAD